MHGGGCRRAVCAVMAETLAREARDETAAGQGILRSRGEPHGMGVESPPTSTVSYSYSCCDCPECVFKREYCAGCYTSRMMMQSSGIFNVV